MLAERYRRADASSSESSCSENQDWRRYARWRPLIFSIRVPPEGRHDAWYPILSPGPDRPAVPWPGNAAGTAIAPGNPAGSSVRRSLRNNILIFDRVSISEIPHRLPLAARPTSG